MICMASDRTATQALLDWWHGKRGERAMPSRAELDPIELKAILPNLLLIDVAPAPNGSGHVFSCRLAGTDLDERFGLRLTGLSLDQMPLCEARSVIQQQYETAVAEIRPVFCTHSLMMGDRYVEYDRTVVPLSGSAGEVKALAAAVDFKCAYLLANGQPPDCTHPDHCDRIGRCLSRPPLP